MIAYISAGVMPFGRRRLLTLLSRSSCGIEQTAAQSSRGVVHANLLSMLDCLAA